MSEPFKMKGSGHYGHGNQHSKGSMPMYDSPAHKALVGDQENLPEELKAKISAAPYASPAKQNESSKESKKKEIKKKDNRSKARKVWDKATQIGMGLKGSLHADSTSSSDNVISSFIKGYNKEKQSDEEAGRS